MWRRSVAHTHGVRGVAGSNPVIPTNKMNLILNYIRKKDFCNFKKKKLKKILLIIAITTASIISCNAQENPPKVQSPNKTTIHMK